MPDIERFGQTLINVPKLLSVTYHAGGNNMTAYAVATFETGQTVNLPATDARKLIEAYPNKGCTCHTLNW